MKRCSKCGDEKPLEEFYADAGCRDGRRPECKACNRAMAAARHRANPGPARDRAKAWQKENPDRYQAIQDAYRQSGRKKVADRKSHLKRVYGLTVEEYGAMLAAQGGGCAICKRPPREDISLHVDHDHDTGHIRGILCFPCNNGIGDFGHDLALLEAAAAYLRRTAAA